MNSASITPPVSKMSHVLRLSDSLVLIMSMWFLRFFWPEGSTEKDLMVSLLGVGLYFFFGEMNNLFHSWRGFPLGPEIRRTLSVWLAVAAGLILIRFVLDVDNFLDKRHFLAWFGVNVFLLPLDRILMRKVVGIFRNHGRNIKHVALVPSNELSHQLQQIIEKTPEAGMRLVGYYENDDGECPKDIYRGDLMRLVEDAHKGVFNRIYIALPLSETNRIQALLTALSDTTVSVYLVPDFFTYELLHSRMGYLGNYATIAFSELPYNGPDWLVKRTFDILFSLIFLFFGGIPMLLIAAAVRLTSPGPAIFKQKRYGLNGEAIEVWKFRSMRTMDNGDVVKQATLGDARITPLGAILRKTSLDELPQFLNVLFGDMSVVGPRPHAVAHNEQYRLLIRGYMMRHKVKPGITGWAQVNGWRGETETLDKMQKRIEFDLDYIRQWSIWLDIRIVFQTITHLLFPKNVY
jgi:putative colanic acid biosysnthesis UDP-glucose lipid carrier transferase